MRRAETEPTRRPFPLGYSARLALYAALAVALLLAPVVLARDPFLSLAALLGLTAGVWTVLLLRALLSRDALLLVQNGIELFAMGVTILLMRPLFVPLTWGHAGLFAAGAVPTVAALADGWRSGVLAPLDAGREGLTPRQWIVPWGRKGARG